MPMVYLRRIVVAFALLCVFAGPVAADDLETLARDFWAWRRLHQPLSGDDIPRLARPADWLPNWSAEAVAAQREALVGFEARWKQLEASRWPVSQQVDYRLIGSAIARVRWELEVTRGWQRNPLFYIDQTLGAIFDRLLKPPPFDAARSAEIVRRLENFPRIVEQAKTNLTDARAPFARLAINDLKDAGPRLRTVARELKPLLAAESAARLDGAAAKAIAALEAYRAWLEANLPKFRPETAVGRADYVWFLKHVALLPYTPEELIAMGRQEWERSVAFEAYERNGNGTAPALSLPRDAVDQTARMDRAIDEVLRFLAAKNIQTVPSWVRRYRVALRPAYLEPLSGLGVTNDLTGPDRLNADGTSWMPAPSGSLAYFYRVYALDPRTQIAHESHGHYLQLVLSWAHENWIRRHYYDSGPNEGLAFYNEELMLQCGLFDASPRTREIIYNMMRLRALRVEVDVKLATGEYSIEQAAGYLRTKVPVDEETAAWEAAFFASGPGQAITYQIGKRQILALLADAKLRQGDAFRLRDFHDYVWKNGNVPFSLQRWELLGQRDWLDAADRSK
jgi:uncharacterized protein (DUF885 family)